MPLGAGVEERRLMNVQSGSVTLLEDKLVCSFKLVVNVVLGGVR